MAQKTKRKITPYGMKIKKRLLKMGLTQAEFCRMHNIPQNKLCDVIRCTSDRRYMAVREKINDVLKIS